jgi:transposase
MRGTFRNQAGLFSYLSLEERVPERHPLRNIRELVRAVLVDMTKDFAALYSDEGRPSIPPEQLLTFRDAAGGDGFAEGHSPLHFFLHA